MSENRLTEVFKFEKANYPLPYEPLTTDDSRYVLYGLDNLYPNFLLKLYADSSTHSAILDSKTDYIIGDGLQANGKGIDFIPNPSDTFYEFAMKVIKDYLLFNYFCVEVIYNNLKKPIELHHVPAHRIRVNKSKTKFWYSEDWMKRSKQYTYDRWKKYSADSTSKLFFFDGYFPSINNIYPKIEYEGAIKSILTEIAIQDFNLNNIKNHFSASSIITFHNGANVPDDTKRKVLSDLKNSYSGETGNKMIVDFQTQEGKAAEVTNLSAGDWDKAYTLVKQAATDDIMIAHKVTSPMLFGVKTEGQLGGSTELETAYNIFLNTYIRDKRNILLSAFNMLLLDNGFVQGKLEFKDRTLFKSEISEQLKEKIMTLNELRKEAGLTPLPNGDQLLSGNPTPKQDNVSSDASQAAIQPADEVKKKPSLKQLSEDDFEKIKHFGSLREEFDFMDDGEPVIDKIHFNKINLKFDTAQQIADYILKNGADSPTELQEAIKRDLSISISPNELRSILDDLSKSGVIDSTVDGDSIKIRKPQQPKKQVTSMYAYEVRPGLGEPIVKNSRAFCQKLIRNNRLFTRAEIQQMSDLFDYDIFKYAGGFYTDPDSHETTAYCRHHFKRYSVAKRN